MIKETCSSQAEVNSDGNIVTRPSRHDKWKRARQKPSGEYTSDVTESVVKRIVSNSNL